ncbi:hypothetical protein J8273_1518 [Carpediemonas membranifera]|uniref:Uncharacterized protein n=1 Tax=Carpediemonas membranifera TaxID=201153 RepID=A0A8J6EB82_9EUKA|nr:hypothetical protein J8273_1518 [Carpediemonas membranifera]|eukprot:KAG9396520.1 hypothetical protein J8273_1518 [Carpediemonas membranifera]
MATAWAILMKGGAPGPLHRQAIIARPLPAARPGLPSPVELQPPTAVPTPVCPDEDEADSFDEETELEPVPPELAMALARNAEPRTAEIPQRTPPPPATPVQPQVSPETPSPPPRPPSNRRADSARVQVLNRELLAQGASALRHVAEAGHVSRLLTGHSGRVGQIRLQMSQGANTAQLNQFFSWLGISTAAGYQEAVSVAPLPTPPQVPRVVSGGAPRVPLAVEVVPVETDQVSSGVDSVQPGASQHY